MTTVVFDGITLASDSQTTASLTRSLTSQHCPGCDEPLNKMHSFRNKLVIGYRKQITFRDEIVIAYAGSGSVGMIKALGHALEKGIALQEVAAMVNMVSGRLNEHNGQGDASLLIVGQKTVWRVNVERNSTAIEKITKFPVAIGSGGKLALMGINRLGFNSVGGIACAIDGDDASGGNINYYNCREKVLEETISCYPWTKKDTDELFEETLKGK